MTEDREVATVLAPAQRDVNGDTTSTGRPSRKSRRGSGASRASKRQEKAKAAPLSSSLSSSPPLPPPTPSFSQEMALSVSQASKAVTEAAPTSSADDRERIHSPTLSTSPLPPNPAKVSTTAAQTTGPASSSNKAKARDRAATDSVKGSGTSSLPPNPYLNPSNYAGPSLEVPHSSPSSTPLPSRRSSTLSISPVPMSVSIGTADVQALGSASSASTSATAPQPSRSSSPLSSPQQHLFADARLPIQGEQAITTMRAASLPGGYGNAMANGRTRASTSGIHPPPPQQQQQQFRFNQAQATNGTLIAGLPSQAQLAAQASMIMHGPQQPEHPPSLHHQHQHQHQHHPQSHVNAHTHAHAHAFALHQLQQQLSIHERFVGELTNCIIHFLSPILPTEDEYRIKENTRRHLEKLACRVSPGARLLAFGSMANGFALRNSDMDLCCLLDNVEGGPDGKLPQHKASELVEKLGALIREETDYTVMPLPKARIPIIKISRPASQGVPFEISCDIGFENRLALENTRLLLSYAMVDPPRLRTLVLFLKVWTKRRKINSPWTGTLSSYGFTLMMLFFLCHVKRPAVLPNLQRLPPSKPIAKEEVELNGHNIYFYDDIALLRQEWTSENTETVGELLIDFFRYFSKEFSYSKDVVSIRTEGGLISKDNKEWTAELCIEDPFQLGYNVSRTVTKDGLYTIRGEFMRASRILSNHHNIVRADRVQASLDELCEEREDGLTRAPEGYRTRQQHGSFNNFGYSVDPRTLHPRGRHHYEGLMSSGFGGSFAFEEMARSLGQAQRNPIAYPPTTAMLAPLSQSTGLSPRQTVMRAGLRFDARTRQPAGSSPSTLVPSSARSDDGAGSADSFHHQVVSRTTTNASARTSPSLSYTLPHRHHQEQDQQHDDEEDAKSVLGDSFALGSEISFGSERFQLHPHPESCTSSSPSSSSARSASGRAQLLALEQQASYRADSSGHGNANAIEDSLLPPGADGPGQRTSRSFSDGVNRSMSLPRPIVDPAEAHRRASIPLRSEPPSPKAASATKPRFLGLHHHARNPMQSQPSLRHYPANVPHALGYLPGISGAHGLQPAMASLSVNNNQMSHCSLPPSANGHMAPHQTRRTSPRSNSGSSQADASSPLRTASDVVVASAGPGGGGGGSIVGHGQSPYLSHSSWSFLQPSSATMYTDPTQNTLYPSYATPGVIPGSRDSIEGIESVSDRFVLDDDDDGAASISDGTLDELARVSALEADGVDSPTLPSEQKKRHRHPAAPRRSPSHHLRTAGSGNDHAAVRSWAVQQSQRMEQEKSGKAAVRTSSPSLPPTSSPTFSSPLSPVMMAKSISSANSSPPHAVQLPNFGEADGFAGHDENAKHTQDDEEDLGDTTAVMSSPTASKSKAFLEMSDYVIDDDERTPTAPVRPFTKQQRKPS